VVVQSKEMDYYGRGLVSREAGFLCAQRQKDEATLLPRTMQEGIEVGYCQALIETHLETETSHERVFVGVQHGVPARDLRDRKDGALARPTTPVGFALSKLALGLAWGIGLRHTMRVSRHLRGSWRRIHE